MSADPFIQAPTDTQSYNRYSYVRNNPVNLVDPSGYNWLSKQWKKWGKPILAIAAAAIITFYTVGAGGASLGAAWSSFFGSVAAGTTTATSMMAAGALAGGAAGAIMTGTVKGTLTGALWGAASAGIANHIGHAKSFASISKSLGGYGKHLAHGLSRGLISKLQGGTFRAGFYSGFAASAFSPGTTMGGDGSEGFTLRTTMAGVIGGTASELGGGKFANGAVSGAFVHMFNHEQWFKDMKSTVNGNILKNDQSKEIFKANAEQTRQGLVKGLEYTRTVSTTGLFFSMRTGQLQAAGFFLGARQVSDFLISGLGGQDSYAIYRHAIIDVATQPLGPVAPVATYGLRVYTKTSGDNYAK